MKHTFLLAIGCSCLLPLQTVSTVHADEKPKFAEGEKAGELWAANGLGMKFRWCPPGTFTMGSPEDEEGREDTEDQVKVTLTKGFWLGQYEVTQGEWKKLMGTTPWKGGKFFKEGSTYPAGYVHWPDAMSFCKKLTEQEQKAGRIPTGWIYTLPTDAQWEYACRAGTTTRFSFGDDEAKLSEYAWFDKNAFEIGEKYAHEVGQKKPNAWNLYDMHGNQGEWCRDLYGNALPGGADPEVTEGGRHHVLRHGGFNSAGKNARCASRGLFFSFARPWPGLGLRVALVQTRP